MELLFPPGGFCLAYIYGCEFSRFLASACQLAKALEIPLVNDLGFTKRYVRCLQV